MDIKKTLGENVKRLRISSGMPQEKLAVLMGVDQAYISKLEAGKKNLTIDTLWLVAEALGVSPSELLELR